ncbi:MAG: hypothetical protein ABFC77_07610 [Thermoguttaceae bacterium]
MVARMPNVASIVSLFLFVIVFHAALSPDRAAGWSITDPLSLSSGSSTSKSSAKKPAAKPTAQEPSVWDKTSSGTKNFFNKTGETLGLKKPEPKKITYAVPRTPVVQRPAKKDEPSWWSKHNPFKASEPEKPKKVTDWMNNPRP